jgi:hypothetical protein
MSTKTFPNTVCHAAIAAGLLLAVWAGIHFLLGGQTPATIPTAQRVAPSIRVDPQGGTAVDVFGLTKEHLTALANFEATPELWIEVFSVRVAGPDDSSNTARPAVLGSYAVEDDVLRFRPRFPLARGVRYQAVFDPAALPALAAAPGGPPLAAQETLILPKPSRATTTTVAHVYPSAERLPENLLKFYVHFSAPMSRGGVYQYIHLLGPGGKEVELPFLELDEELWNRESTRFTLLFDPGRIKRGLKPREEVGPPLEEGKTYTLLIDRAWPDAEGEPLGAVHRKTFKVFAPDETPPDPENWRVQPPAATTRGPLTVSFPEPLDHALLLRLLEVSDQAGRPVVGQSQVLPGETAWEFTPREPWRAGDYRLVIDTRLEDLAGNRIGRPFDVDLFQPIQRQVTAETVTLRFAVTPSR